MARQKAAHARHLPHGDHRADAHQATPSGGRWHAGDLRLLRDRKSPRSPLLREHALPGVSRLVRALRALRAGRGTPPHLAALPSSSAAVKPSALHPAGSHRSPGPDLTTVGPPPAHGITLTAAPTQPARQVEPSPPSRAAEPALPATARRPPRYEFIRETQAPVAVKPVDEPAPDRPPGEAVASGKHGLWFGLDQHDARRGARPPGQRRSPGWPTRARWWRASTYGSLVFRKTGCASSPPGSISMWVGRPTWSSILRRRRPPLPVPVWPKWRSRRGPCRVRRFAAPSTCASTVGTYSDLEILHAPHELTVRRTGDFQLALRNNGNAPMDAETRPGPAGPPRESAAEVRAAAGDHSSPEDSDGGRPGPSRPASVDRVPRHALPADRCPGGGRGEPHRRQPCRREDGAEAAAAPVGAQGAGASRSSGRRRRSGRMELVQAPACAVPSVINQPVDLAMANLSKAGFKGVPLNAANPSVAQGRVPPGSACRGPSPSRNGHRHHRLVRRPHP